MTPRTLIFTGSVFMALAVALGAFGAHIVQNQLTPEMYNVFQTAVEYHFYHSLGILILGVVILNTGTTKWFRWSGISFFTGILIFSGSLYIYTLTGARWLGMITPVGGLAFILGWGLLAAGIWKTLETPRS